MGARPVEMWWEKGDVCTVGEGGGRRGHMTARISVNKGNEGFKKVVCAGLSVSEDVKATGRWLHAPRTV